MINLILVALSLSIADKNNIITVSYIKANNQTASFYDTSKKDTSYVFTGFYFLAEQGQGIKIKRDRSDEFYNISKTPFVSVKNVLRAIPQKNVIQGRDTYALTIVLDNQGTSDLEKGTGNRSQQHIAVVIANRLLYVVENTTQIKTGIMQLHLLDYSEKEVNDMVSAINQKR